MLLWFFVVLLPVVLGAGRTTCTSSLPGDYRYEGCGAFCKPEKAQNHCKFCKCRACNFCASAKAAAASAVPVPSATQVSPEPPLKKKKKKRKLEGSSDAAMANANAPPAGSSTTKKACASGMPGDFAYETCGGFCKPAKAANHCKFCKCKSCTFCGGSMGEPATPSKLASTPALRASAAAPSMPATSVPSASVPAGEVATRSTRAPVGAGAPIAGEAAPAHAGLVGMVGGGVLLLIVICGVAAFCGDSEVIRRAFGCCASTKVAAKDEGEAFLQKAPSEDERLDADGGLHPGLDAAFRHVEKLEASMLHKSAR